ncbi:MAG TPA: MaoC family dehydratase N-terminal domain-containing protein [Solirubrobacteraceae bacterium]|nr:MaoC family dehydratase N-terminal domain-containing protein [Solirubrobacteraceae bacterium]
MTAEARVGHAYGPFAYTVTRAAIDAYVGAVGEDPELWGEIAPPMFAVVFAGPALAPGFADPQLGIDFSRLVHGGQEFRWPGPVVRAGDTVSTVARVRDVREAAGVRFYVFSTESHNDRGELVVAGVWTNIVRASA